MIKQFFMMIGAPGSGKSTWLKRQLKDDIDAYVSRDEIRFAKLQDGDDYFAHEDEVFNEFADKLATYLKEDNGIIRVFADASHLNHKSRMKLLNALKARGVDFENSVEINTIWMYTSLETCLARNAQREGRARVPDATVIEMFKNQREPELNEHVKKVYIVNEHKQCMDIKFFDATDTNNFVY